MFSTKVLARTGLLLTLTLIFQSLRMLLPLPPFLSVFIIGTLVNSCLIVAVHQVGLKPALGIALFAPAIAYFQQLLLLPVFIIPVACGNIVYVTIFGAVIKKGAALALLTSASAKALLLYICFKYLLHFIEIPNSIAASILMVMSWPQFLTALLGGTIAIQVVKRFRTIAR